MNTEQNSDELAGKNTRKKKVWLYCSLRGVDPHDEKSEGLRIGLLWLSKQGLSRRNCENNRQRQKLILGVVAAVEDSEVQ
jgi:hypothetical protein